MLTTVEACGAARVTVCGANREQRMLLLPNTVHILVKVCVERETLLDEEEAAAPEDPEVLDVEPALVCVAQMVAEPPLMLPPLHDDPR